jgi:dephospho-CoA kinase
VEIPLLFEKNLEAEFDLIVCVSSSEMVRLRRLAERGLGETESRARMASQLPLEEKVKRSDVVLFNDGDLGFLDEQVGALVERLRLPS